MTKIRVVNHGVISKIECDDPKFSHTVTTRRLDRSIENIKKNYNLDSVEIDEVQGDVKEPEALDERPHREPEPPHSNLPENRNGEAAKADAGME